ncbi:MAG: peptidoglycan -binding protein [Proteobacteria bacterium]|nr:peptidoglycan -binding protein [Pseudomonadota bacterium]
MVIIFVLLVFVLAQAFLSVALSGRSKELDRATRDLSQLSEALSLEQSREADLQQSLARATTALSARTAERDRLQSQLNAAVAQGNAAQAQADAAKREIAELQKTVTADRATIEAKLGDLANLSDQVKALTALRDDLEKQARDAAARAMTDAERRAAVESQLSDERKLGDSARAQIALLNRQIDALKQQLSSISATLDLKLQEGRDKDTQIGNLVQKLNVALASKVEELQQYRSEFFGRLRTVLANRPGVQVIGDRFVFQSEVLFPVGSAELTPAGAAQIRALALTIKEIAAEIPPDVRWILRVDGHTDPQPVKGGTYASNWELSAGRAITVVKLLIAEGVPADHLAATGFGEYQPFGAGDTPDAYAKDRRIEVRLTDR